MKNGSMRRRESGVALVLALLLLAAMSIGGVMMMLGSTGNLRSHSQQTQYVACLNVANQGLVEGQALVGAQAASMVAVDGFYAQTDRALASGSQSLGSRAFSYSVTAKGNGTAGATDASDQGLQVESTCRFAGAEVSVKATGNVGGASLFEEELMCGCRDVTLNSNYGTDAYDATLGSYASQLPGAGHVGANRDITMDSNVQISGNAVAGDDIVIDSNSTIQGDAIAGDRIRTRGSADVVGTETPNVSPAPSPCDCASYDIDGQTAAAALSNDNGSMGSCSSHLSGDDFSISSNDSCTLPAGTYYFRSFEIDSNARVSLAGPVRIFFDGNDGPFQVKSNGKLNLGGDPQNLQIFAKGNETILFDSNADLSMYLYAPNATFEQNSNALFFGAVKARDLVLDSNGFFHGDRNALRQNHIAGSFVPTSWAMSR